MPEVGDGGAAEAWRGRDARRWRLTDARPAAGDLLAEVLEGLAARRLPPRLFYDARGSALFERICTLPEYYLTRTERALLARHAGELARRCGRGLPLVELGAGSLAKVGLLLEALRPSRYLPVDLAAEALERGGQALLGAFPWLRVHALCADFGMAGGRGGGAPGLAALLEAALREDPRGEVGPRLLFFPGSTIGNLAPEEARAFLAALRPAAGPGGWLLVGVDLDKDPEVLERAYDDAQGVTAAFNRNLLERLRRELGAAADPGAFGHRARYRRNPGRIEMHLVSLRPQAIRLAGRSFPFAAGEAIHTEDSHKYALGGFRELAREAGWVPEAAWRGGDPDGLVPGAALFSLHLLRVPPG